MKNVDELKLYRFASDLEKAIAAFVRYNNEQGYHESRANDTPADVYFG